MTKTSDIEKLFENTELYTQALTHKSWVNEHPNVRGTNERLEFLGDAVLEFLVSRELFVRFPDKEEGYLTALRANLVNTQNLAEVARKLGVGEAIYLSKGEEDGGGRTNPSLLADTMEAIIGALFMDRNLEMVSDFVKENLLSEISEKTKGPLKDAKSLLQEYVQSKGLPTPRYEVVEESGPDHDKEFVIRVDINGKPQGVGRGKSKSLAEQAAAKVTLEEYCK